jgi:cell volume regulation protein A
VDEIGEFGTILLLVSGGISLFLVAGKLSERFPVPAPAIFLLIAAVVSDLVPAIEDHVPILTVERIATVALIVILLDGGMHIGWRRFRGSALPITLLGVLGTFATAGVMAFFAHTLFDFGWTTAWIIGAALAPTDPAVMFSVLGNREVGGRTGTILEGESGANDPVGIALMIGMLEFATSDHGSIWGIAREFTVEMAVGLAVGVAGAWALARLLRLTLPAEGLYPIRVLAAAGVIYGAASVLGGSGFLAVFVAGLLIGDLRAPYKAEIESFHDSLASLAEVVVFVALGLTMDLTSLADDRQWLDGLVLAVLLAIVARPLVVALLLLPARLRPGERIFLMWGGLKGAVPILLAAFVVLAGVADADRIYGIVFVVVAFSVIVQGSTIPYAAGRLGVPMRTVEPRPWSLSVGLRADPEDVHRFTVAESGRAAGHAIRDLPLGERSWIGLVIGDGAARQPRGSYVLRPGDEVVMLADDRDLPALARLFEGPHA